MILISLGTNWYSACNLCLPCSMKEVLVQC
uniref:Uncharacterized protein n=1 Tax=Anguilla anguilla TaxID=7936 RepID=A0A0E9PXE5_ANGAN